MTLSPGLDNQAGRHGIYAHSGEIPKPGALAPWPGATADLTCLPLNIMFPPNQQKQEV
jgi:hypothetical protein